MYSTKTLHKLETDVLELPDNKSIEKFFSELISELFSLNQANFSSDPSQILILQSVIPSALLPPSPSLSNSLPG